MKLDWGEERTFNSGQSEQCDSCFADVGVFKVVCMQFLVIQYLLHHLYYTLFNFFPF